MAAQRTVTECLEQTENSPEGAIGGSTHTGMRTNPPSLLSCSPPLLLFRPPVIYGVMSDIYYPFSLGENNHISVIVFAFNSPFGRLFDFINHCLRTNIPDPVNRIIGSIPTIAQTLPRCPSTREGSTPSTQPFNQRRCEEYDHTSHANNGDGTQCRASCRGTPLKGAGVLYGYLERATDLIVKYCMGKITEIGSEI